MNNTDTRYVRNTAIAVAILFQSKWRVQILCALRSGPVRLGQLARRYSGSVQEDADANASREQLSNLQPALLWYATLITLLYKNVDFVRYDFLLSPVPSIRKRRVALIGGENRELGIVTAGEFGPSC
jgi:hypothetical protein